ncbi:hypothetical protein MY8738_008355 [Beauveria namnaoensis]
MTSAPDPGRVTNIDHYRRRAFAGLSAAICPPSRRPTSVTHLTSATPSANKVGAPCPLPSPPTARVSVPTTMTCCTRVRSCTRACSRRGGKRWRWIRRRGRGAGALKGWREDKRHEVVVCADGIHAARLRSKLGVTPNVTPSESCCYRCIIITRDKLAALEVVAAWQREKGEVGTDTESKSSR